MRLQRRKFLKMLGASGAALAVPALLASCGGDDDDAAPATASSEAPTTTAPANASAPATSGAAVLKASSDEKVKIGFIALTDCASVVMAQELGLFRQYGLNVELAKQANWAALRDGLLSGDIQAAHMLFGMPFSVFTGVGGTAGKQIPIAMMLNNNGQAITLSNEDFGGKVGFRTLDKVKPAVEAVKAKKEATFAMTFPGGTHDMWLRYWLAAAGVDQKMVKVITIPPPQMVANMKVNAMDGYCVGEPWNGVAVKEEIGFTALASQDVWKHHPEKALGLNAEFLGKRRDDVKLVMRAILEASRFIDDPKNKAQVAKTIGAAAYVNAPADVIDGRLEGKYALGKDLGEHVYTDDYMYFFRDGQVNLPRKAHAAWFMAQYVRFGYLKELPDAKGIAEKLVQTDLYNEVAKEMSIPVPEDDMAPFSIDLDQARFDPADAAGYLKKYGGTA
ncbi:MAG: ABC transporter substrate-binding protein [Chloroflexi bacterium]|nr:ABC transporter substrate-binding protein [Chloroflexota bacterium]